MRVSKIFALIVFISMIFACKPTAVSFNSGEQASATPLTLTLPKDFTGQKLDGSCTVSEVECIEYRGLDAKNVAAQAKSCKSWLKEKKCPSTRIVGACYGKAAPRTAIHIYKNHPSAVSMKRAIAYCGAATYYPAK